MAEHAPCPKCDRLELEDELCEDCGLCVRCCECEGWDEFDADELGLDPDDDLRDPQ